MDILHLVDRLEELFNESRALPFTRNVVVDEDKMLDIIDQMRVTIPEEVKKAQQMLAPLAAQLVSPALQRKAYSALAVLAEQRCDAAVAIIFIFCL